MPPRNRGGSEQRTDNRYEIPYSVKLSSGERDGRALDDERPIDHRNKGVCSIESIVVDVAVQVFQCADVGCTKTR